jgi:hypothetical protein
VTDADSDLLAGAAKTEDLRVADEDAPDWSNITEVRGHTAGGETKDLQRLARFASTFSCAPGQSRPAAGTWSTISWSRTLADADEDIDTFAEDGGLVIDTRQLFDLISRVEDGLLDAAEARTCRQCTTRPHQRQPGTTTARAAWST